MEKLCDSNSSRSSRRTRRTVEKATIRRERLLDKGKLSLPSGEGIAALVVSGYATYPISSDPRQSEKEHRDRIREAERLASLLSSRHQAIDIRPQAHMRDIKDLFNNPEVTDIIMIGHGSINGLMTDDRGAYYSWEHAAKHTNYLKRGAVEQRTCGHFPVEMNYCVPMGTFAVESLSSITAAIGQAIDLPTDGSTWDHYFEPIFSDSAPLMEQLDDMNDRYRQTVPVKPV